MRYDYITVSGKARVDRPEWVSEQRARGRRLVLQLDANICFELMRVGDGRTKLEDNERLSTLLLDARAMGAAIDFTLGVAELSLDHQSLSLNTVEYSKRHNAAVIALDRFSGIDTHSPSFPADAAFMAEAVDAYLPRFALFYAHLLKLQLILTDDTFARDPAGAFISYAEWSTHDLMCSSTLCLQVAAVILGGYSWFHPFLRLGKKGVNPTDAARNAAWDLLHIHMMQAGHHSVVEGRHQFVVLASADARLIHLGDIHRFTGLGAHGSSGFVGLGEIVFDYPRLRKDQSRIKARLEELRTDQRNRRGRDTSDLGTRAAEIALSLVQLLGRP